MSSRSKRSPQPASSLGSDEAEAPVLLITEVQAAARARGLQAVDGGGASTPPAKRQETTEENQVASNEVAEEEPATKPTATAEPATKAKPAAKGGSRKGKTAAGSTARAAQGKAASAKEPQAGTGATAKEGKASARAAGSKESPEAGGLEVRVRRLHRRDLNRTWEFLKLVFRDVNRKTVEYQRPRSKVRFVEAYEEAGEQLLFEIDDQIVGYAECSFDASGADNWINPRYFDNRGMRPLYVDELAVHPDYQGFGVGSFMIDQVQHLARARGCTHLVLEVAENNKSALSWYHKRNFFRLDAAIFLAQKVPAEPELLPPRKLPPRRAPKKGAKAATTTTAAKTSKRATTTAAKTSKRATATAAKTSKRATTTASKTSKRATATAAKTSKRATTTAAKTSKRTTTTAAKTSKRATATAAKTSKRTVATATKAAKR